ncbi:MAG: PKD domain-containing protein, partial [Acidobacteria bacterium]|nr:PKD domain-containing protein [Acidobacteriota bacterium]
RDNSDFDQVGDFEVNPYSMALDVEGGCVFMVANRRIQIWDARNNPGNPPRVFDLGFRSSGLTWTPDAHAFFILEDVDAPDGDPNVMGLVGTYGVGTAIYDTSVKDNPTLKYQHHGGGFWARGIYATTLGSTEYAFAAVDQTAGVQGGLMAYDMTAAKALSGRCTEVTGGSVCPGVFKGTIGSRTRVQSVDGAGNFVVIASGVSPRGFEIWNVANPSSPTRVMEGLTGDPVYGVAMWQEGASFYLATRTQLQGSIYNVSCIVNGSCGLGTATWSRSLPSSTVGTITFSRSNTIPFLYFGIESDCLAGNQNEWLYDVSNPSSPRDISPQGTVVIDGEPVSYWGWYYRQNGVHGFNRVAPRMGKFYNEYFFRAGYAVFDIHRRTGASPPSPNFSWTPSEIYPGTLVSFTDQSTGAPTAWDWDFLPDGIPSSSTQQNPSGIQFPSLGSKTVNLAASNAAGSNSTSRMLQVLDPVPSIGGVAASPNPALVCQPVTFTAQDVTGRPPTAFSWQVTQTGGGVVAVGGDLNPFVWTSDPGDATGVTYVAEVTVSNADGSDSQTSAPVTLNPLEPLPPSNGFAPTYDGQPAPPPSPTVQFHVAASGATEWNWNFGDNPGGGPNGDGYEGWTSDPVAGPNPEHTYGSIGIFSVRARVRNCVEAERESSAISVDIIDTTPLEADFSASLFCQISVCFADTGESITFDDASVGSPDFWDYDWDGDGDFEDTGNATPVTAHTYGASDVYFPTLRIRRGAAMDLYEDHLAINVGGATPNPSIQVSGPASGAVGANLVFSAAADDCRGVSDGWTWTSDGGAGSSTNASLTVSWASPGAKTVTATNSGCIGVTGMTTVTIVSGNEIFADGFESGDTTAWSATDAP